MMRFVSIRDLSKNMANGMRMLGKEPLTYDEIELVKREIKFIEADESVFVFNDKIHKNTCYVPEDDIIYIGRNIFPDTKYGSIHPRDLMSIAAVLAHEYYGHRMFRDEYLNDKIHSIVTTPTWADEARASINAAKITPNLPRSEQVLLIQDAMYRAQEFGQIIENDSFMKEVLYGYHKNEKHIAGIFNERIVFIGSSGERRILEGRKDYREMSEVRDDSDDYEFGPTL